MREGLLTGASAYAGWIAVPAILLALLVAAAARRDPKNALRSYFEDPEFLRLFFACSDQEVEAAYDKWAQTNLKQIAMRAFNVEEGDLTRQTDYLWGTLMAPVDLETRDEKGKVTAKKWAYKERQGSDEIWRANTRLFAIILYGRDQIMICTTFYNVVGDAHTTSNTHEYFYNHIASIETNQNSFVLASSAGTKIEVPLAATGGRHQTGDRDRAEDAVRNVRAMLRERMRGK